MQNLQESVVLNIADKRKNNVTTNHADMLFKNTILNIYCLCLAKSYFLL